MSMSRTAKDAEVQELKGIIEKSESVIVTHYTGMTVSQLSEFRGKLREQGATFKVTKNTLMRLALKGSRFEGITDMFTGPTGIAVSNDPIAAAKVTHGYAADNEKLVILGGAMGETRLDPKGVEAVAKLPGLDEIRGKLVGILVAPAQRLATVSQAPAAGLARLMSAKAAKGE